MAGSRASAPPSTRTSCGISGRWPTWARCCAGAARRREARSARRRPGAVPRDELPWLEGHEVVGRDLAVGGVDEQSRAGAALLVERLGDRGERRVAGTRGRQV